MYNAVVINQNNTSHMNNTASKQYNDSLTVADLTRQEALDPSALHLFTYSGPKDTCEGIASGRLGNMAGGFHLNLFGVKWYGTEHLYLCGEWSQEGERSVEIQEYIRKMVSGVYAKRCSKAKYKAEIRPDFTTFRYDWMLWCVWQKCLLNKDFAALLCTIPDDVVIVEVVKNDPVWAAYPDSGGIIRGGNAMGKILTICRRHLIEGTEPAINRQLLSDADIYILGKKVEF